jgi:hypothetical protein
MTTQEAEYQVRFIDHGNGRHYYVDGAWPVRNKDYVQPEYFVSDDRFGPLPEGWEWACWPGAVEGTVVADLYNPATAENRGLTWEEVRLAIESEPDPCEW